MVRSFALQLVDLRFNPLSSHTKRLKKMVSTAYLLGAWNSGEVVENKPASSLVVPLGKALNGTPPPLCGRQVAQTTRKWQLPSECGRPVQNIAIQFAFSWMEDKYEQYNTKNVAVIATVEMKCSDSYCWHNPSLLPQQWSWKKSLLAITSVERARRWTYIAGQISR